MCTLLVAHRVWPDAALVVAANRDEKLTRAAQPPAWRAARPLPVLAPLDLQEGGTWLGLNTAGIFAGITNRFGVPRDGSRRSRGELVLNALAAQSARAGAERIAGLAAADYNPFHLVVASQEEAHLVWSDGAHLNHQSLEAGIHVVTERSLGAAPNQREGWLRDRAGTLAPGRAPEPAALGELLRVHGTPPLEGTCVHLPAWRYGTRSSTLLYLREEGVRFLHADGPPCQMAYEDLSELAAGGLDLPGSKPEA